ncbi:MAG: hypothetical protein OK422_01900 [Thaumarchaeota archaeon]|nr:hypothetical protein [Nitrososphaerota archaeon]
MVSRTYHVSKTFNAPLEYVFDWCTDFRDEDPIIASNSTKRRIIEKTKTRAIYISKYVNQGKKFEGVRIVALEPPNKWHLDGVAEDQNETGEYRLTALGRKKTRLDMAFKVIYKKGKPASKKSWEGDTSGEWDRFRAALERDYTSGRSATA